VIDSFIPQGSSYAGDIDQLIVVIAVIVMAWFFAAQAIFFGFIFKFKAKDGVKAVDMDGYNPAHKRWVSYPHYAVLVFDVIILVMAVRVWNNVKIDMPAKIDDTVTVVAQRWSWSFAHAGPDGALDTADDIKTAHELHVKVGDVVKFEGSSRDVLHSFSIPLFRLKQDLIPGRVTTGWFKATKTGTYEIQCTEICGIGHGMMSGRVVIETPEEHAAWLAAHAAKK
jgi:cytochrome c oxidase subunit II